MVGRSELLVRMTETLASPAATVVVLCGPSGIGKSRLASEAAAELALENWFVLPVTASETIAAIPLGALAPALAAGRLDFDISTLDPVGLFDQVRRSIEALSGGRRTVMVVDDLSMLDPLSLAVITQLIGSGTIRLIATLRSGEPLPDAILSMWTSNSATRIDLPPLSIDDHARILSGVLGGTVSHRAAAELHAASGGNPLFLRELVLGAIANGSLIENARVWQLVGEPIGTPALHELIRSRLRHLEKAELALVERIAVCQPVPLSDLADVGSRGTVVSLESEGLVAVSEVGGQLLVSLSHPQYVAAVASTMSRLRVIDLLLDQAAVVSSRSMTPDDELRVASWRLDAGEPSDPALLVRAAHLALIAQDQAAVIRLAAAAIRAGAPAAEMLFLQGEASWTMGRTADAITLLDSAAEADEAAPTTEQLTGLIATARASTYAGESLGDNRGLAVLDAAVARHPGQARSLALVRAVLLLNLEEAELAAEELITARPASDSEEVREALLALSSALPLSAMGRSTESVVAARSAVAYALSDARPAFALRRAQMVLATVLLQAGETAEAKSLTITSLHDAIDHDDELAVKYDELMLGRCFLALGRLDTAARWFRDVISGSHSGGPGAYRDQAKAYLVIALAWQGKAEDAAALLAELSPEYIAQSSTAHLASLWLDGITGDSSAAASAIVALAGIVRARGHNVMASSLLHSAARLGFAAPAVPLAAAIGAANDSALIANRVATVHAEAAGSMTELAVVGERWVSSGAKLFAAEAFASAGNAALNDGRPREAAGFHNRASELQAECGGASTPLLQFGGNTEPLTKREREIAALAAQGFSSNEIAEKLFLSPRTVNNHLQATYAKLGIRGRSELA